MQAPSRHLSPRTASLPNLPLGRRPHCLSSPPSHHAFLQLLLSDCINILQHVKTTECASPLGPEKQQLMVLQANRVQHQPGSDLGHPAVGSSPWQLSCLRQRAQRQHSRRSLAERQQRFAVGSTAAVRAQQTGPFTSSQSPCTSQLDYFPALHAHGRLMLHSSCGTGRHAP